MSRYNKDNQEVAFMYMIMCAMRAKDRDMRDIDRIKYSYRFDCLFSLLEDDFEKILSMWDSASREQGGHGIW